MRKGVRKRKRREEKHVFYFFLSSHRCDEETNSYCHLRDAGKSSLRSRSLCLPALRLRRDDKGHFHALRLSLSPPLSLLSLLNLCPPRCPSLPSVSCWECRLFSHAVAFFFFLSPIFPCHVATSLPPTPPSFISPLSIHLSPLHSSFHLPHS